MAEVIKKVLAGLEDFALGTGTEMQTRGGQQVPVTRVSAEWIFNSLADIKSADTAKIQHVTFFSSSGVKKYDYSPSSTLVGNDDDVLMPTSGVRRCLLRRENYTQSHKPGDDAKSSNREGIQRSFVIEVIKTEGGTST